MIIITVMIIKMGTFSKANFVMFIFQEKKKDDYICVCALSLYFISHCSWLN